MNHQGAETFRVLMVGIMDVISCSIADRLSREGCHILWLTPRRQTPAGNEASFTVYVRDLTPENIQRTVEAHSIDTVIFHSGNPYSGQAADGEPAMIPALQALLDTLDPRSIRHFLLISSVEMNYSDITPRIAEMRHAEELALFAARQHGLPVLILRSGPVYGEGPLSSMGYIGRLYESISNGKTVEERYHADSLVDPIYADDLAVAAYWLLLCDSRGTYCALTGQPITLQQLHEAVGEAARRPVRAAFLEQGRTIEAAEYRDLSMPLRNETGWMPFYLFASQGRQKLCAVLQKATAGSGGKHLARSKGSLRQLADSFRKSTLLTGIAEMLLMFVLAQLLLPYVHGSDDFRYIDIRLIYVVLVAIRYGIGLGLGAVVLACISYFLSLLNSGIDMTYLFYSVDTWVPFILYGISGAIVGYSADQTRNRLEEASERVALQEERYEFLFSLHKEVLAVKGQLQHQLSANRESFGKAYVIAERFDSLSPNKVLSEALDVFSEMMEGCRCSIWLRSNADGYARLLLSNAAPSEQTVKSMRLSDYPEFMSGFDQEGLFINRALDPRYPDFAAPIRSGEHTIALVTLSHVKPECYTLHYQNLFRVLVGLTEKSLLKALRYEEQTLSEMLIPGTTLLNAEALSISRKQMQDECDKSHLTMITIAVRKCDGMSMDELFHRLPDLMRSSDIAGVDASGQVILVLPNASESDFDGIRRRFAAAGVEVVLCKDG